MVAAEQPDDTVITDHTPTRPLRVLVVSDERPGHFKKSIGVVRSIERNRPVEQQWLAMRLRAGWIRKFLRLWWNLVGWRLPLSLLRLAYKVEGVSELHRPDLIVSSGGNTLYANVWLARWFGTRNLFVGTIRGLRETLFSRIVTLDERLGTDERYIVSLLPTEVAPADVDRAAHAWQRESRMSDQRRWTLLIGGDGGGHSYTQEEWQTLIAGLEPLSRRFGIRWLITTSRRTDPAVERSLEQIRDEPWVDDLLIYRTDPRRLFNAYLGSAEMVFATSESAMMISEAAASGRPVVSLRPVRARLCHQNSKLQQLYQARGVLSCVAICDFAATDYSELAAGFGGSELEPMQHLDSRMNQFLRAA